MTSFFMDKPTKVILIDYEDTTQRRPDNPAPHHQSKFWVRVQRIRTESEIPYGGVIEFDSAWLSEHVGVFWDDDIPF